VNRIHTAFFLAVLLIVLVTVLSGCAMFKKEEIDENATVEELYALAKVSMDKGNWGDAVERLRALEAKYPYGAYAEQAQLDTIYAYFRNSEPGLAIAAADRFIKLHPTHSSVDYAYFLKGQASYEEDQSTIGVLLGKDDLSDRDPTLTLNALNAFKDVYTLFPDSKYARDADETQQPVSQEPVRMPPAAQAGQEDVDERSHRQTDPRAQVALSRDRCRNVAA